MLLYQDSILQLEYDPATDILEMEWPDLEPAQLPEVKQALKVMVETVRDYDVKKLLVDGSKSSVSISDEENTSLVLKLAQDFTATRLQKIARVESTDLKTETNVAENHHKIQQSMVINFQMLNFPDRSTALAWLKSAS
ncbi:hypothetical protein [Rufibacter latericius]|uniref:STAS/SEC14 domain-containing protein n=1 Tax=Rufibacter latericius TaxID=2487040 RepID=A0A3M9MUP9_9BACT|nr:hypothetical protein [Rufibacter latericius]RNI29240.1 hypothetical protein EFB08_07415 [Rufibacter latericius]